MDDSDLGSSPRTRRATTAPFCTGALLRVGTLLWVAAVAPLGCDSGATEAAAPAETSGPTSNAGSNSTSPAGASGGPSSGGGGFASTPGAAGTTSHGGGSAGTSGTAVTANTGGGGPAGPSGIGGVANHGGSHAGGTSGTAGRASSGGSNSAGQSNAGAAGMGVAGGPGIIEYDEYDVLVDPYGIAPLVAVVNVHGVEASEVAGLQVVVEGQDGAPDFERQYSPTDPDFLVQLDTSDLTFPQAGTHVPVLGLYADSENSVRIVVDRVDADPIDLTVSIQTRLLNPLEADWLPAIVVRTAVREQMEPGWTVAELNIEPYPGPPIIFVNWTRTIAFDERGAIRWALLPELPSGETFTLTRSLSGNLLTGSFDTIVEITKLGRTVHSLQLSGYSLNHEILQIGSDDPVHASPGPTSEHDGNLLVLASKDGADTIQDHILELDPDTGELLRDWDLSTVFDRSRTTYIDPEQWAPGVGDWLHTNGLAYSNVDESIIVSGRHQGVAKIDRDGRLLWLLAPHAGWQEPQEEKLLAAVDATLTPYDEPVQLGSEAAGDASAPEFDWPFGHHSPALLPNGDLLLFDNGSSRHFGSVCGGFSRAVVFHIDEAAMTVRQMGQFIFSTAESSCFVSNTHLLPETGNLFIQPGGAQSATGAIAIVKEVATQIADDGTVAFDEVVFDATLDMSVGPGSLPYSYRGHRWTF